MTLYFSSWTDADLQTAGLNPGETVAAMSRRSRNSHAWRYVWGGIRRDADARALVLASENEQWTYDRLEVKAKCTSGSFVKFKSSNLPLPIVLGEARSYFFSC